MAAEPPSPIFNRELTSTIVAAYVRRNQIGSDPTRNFKSRQCIRRFQDLENPQQKPGASGYPRCRSVDQFIAIMSFAWTVAGAARCSGGISSPAMD